MSSGRRLIPTKLDLLHSQGEGNYKGSLNHAFVGWLYVVKYLGEVLDSRLTWREHRDVTARKAHTQFAVDL